MIGYSYLRKRTYEDNDMFTCWNMQQNSFYYNECIKSDVLDEQLVDIIIKVETDKVTNKTKERMAFVWKKSDVTRALKNIWDNRPH